MVKIVAISDTHNKHNQLVIPECDFLFHTGDWSFQGYESETRNFAKWLSKQPARNIVITPGNHERYFEKHWPKSLEWIKEECPRAHVLIDQTVEIEGIKIHGSPYTPWFFDWAYNRARGLNEAMIRQIPEIKPHWDKIPEGTNILLTHGPAYEILDELVFPDGTPKGEHVGCHHLLERIRQVKPDIHICGHIHCGFGQKHIDGTSYYNASCCDEMYTTSNGITVIDYVPSN